MLFAGQEPAPLLKTSVLTALVVTMVVLALGILLLFLLFRLVFASSLLLSVLPWDIQGLGQARVNPDIKQGCHTGNLLSSPSSACPRASLGVLQAKAQWFKSV